MIRKWSVEKSSLEKSQTIRRFPPPWTVEALDGGFKIVDSNGQALAYVYGHADHVMLQLPNLDEVFDDLLASTTIDPHAKGDATAPWHYGVVSHSTLLGVGFGRRSFLFGLQGLIRRHYAALAKPPACIKPAIELGVPGTMNPSR